MTPQQAPPGAPPGTPVFSTDPGAAKVIITYGDLGTGKSIDAIYSWAGCGLFLAQPSALDVMITCGVDIRDRMVACGSLEQVEAMIPQAKAAGYAALIIDDASLLAGNSWLGRKPHYEIIEDDKRTGNYNRSMYPEWRDYIGHLAQVARWAGIHLHFSCHFQGAFIDPKTMERYPAGPQFGWKKVVKTMPYMGDCIYWAQQLTPGRPKWDTVCKADAWAANAVMKDRLNVMPARDAPLNTAEALRAAGYFVPRPKGLEWMEDWSEALAQMVVGEGKTEAEAQAVVGKKLYGTVDDKHLRWAMRDGTHRARLRLHAAKDVLAGFGGM